MYVELNFGNICNSNCSYCFDKNIKEKHCLSEEQTYKIIKFLNSIHVDTVEIIGGEPSCFKYCFDLLEKIKCNDFVIITNGMDEIFLKKISLSNKKIKVVHSVHYEMYLRNKKQYISHIKNVCNIFNKKKNINLEFAILIDKEMTYKYIDLLNFIFDYVAKFNYDISTSYVIRDGSVKECVKNLLITYKLGKIGCFIRNDLNEENRNSKLKINPQYNKKCPCFLHYIKINANGFLIHSNCLSAQKSKYSIFDDEFNLSKEIKSIICLEKHNTNNGCCEKVLGINETTS